MKKTFNRHFEWVALSLGLLMMGVMNPYIDNGISWCFFELIGLNYCPGEGLGHSIAFTFRGDYQRAFEANLAGPFAILVIASRVLYLLKEIISNKNENLIKEDG